MSQDASTRRKMLALTAAAGASGPVALALSPDAKAQSRKGFLILACDGGGIRGYLSSLILQRLNQQFGILGAGNKSINLYAGTSTGGLISLGLAYGKSIDSVVNLYKTNGANIFSPLSIQAHCLLSRPVAVQDSFLDVKEFWQVLYDDIGSPSVKTVMESFIPGNPTLGSLPNKVMVTTLQLAASLSTGTAWSPLIIDNMKNSSAGSTFVYDAALSTSAAPVYFPPYYHPTYGWCSDGGLFANNPAPQAVALAIQNGVELSDISLLSIGTGFTNESLTVDSSNRLCAGLKTWAWFEQSGPTPPFPLLNAIMDGVSATNDYTSSQLLGRRYLRVNPVLPYPIALDDYSPAALSLMETTANALFASAQWTQVGNWIKANFSAPFRHHRTFDPE
jgi:uncharacterized protein